MSVTVTPRTHWFLRPDALQDLAPRLLGHAGPWNASPRDRQLEQVPTYETVGDVAVIHVTGVLSKHGSPLLGGTSYVGLRKSLAAFVADESVSSAVMVMDSPGGSGWGLPEAGDAVQRAAAQKPVYSVVDGSMACSACYWLASLSTGILATRASEIGSIGTWSLLVDDSKAWENIGIKFHALRSAPNKARALLPGENITDEDIAYHQSELMQHARMFFGAVRSGRNLSSEQMDAVTTGDVWLASDAKRLGLVDEIVRDLDHAMSRVQSLSRRARDIAAQQILDDLFGDGREAITSVSDPITATVAAEEEARIGGAGHEPVIEVGMAEQDTKPIETAEGLEQAYGSLVASVRDTAASKATEAERRRASRIFGQAKAGQMKLAAELVESGAALEDALVALMDDPRRDAHETAALRTAVAPDAVGPLDATGTVTVVDPEDADSVWDGCAKVRAMFGDDKQCFVSQWTNRERVSLNGRTLAEIIGEAIQ